MFVALMAYPEFFKAHLNLFVAIAPVVFTGSIDTQILMKF